MVYTATFRKELKDTFENLEKSKFEFETAKDLLRAHVEREFNKLDISMDGRVDIHDFMTGVLTCEKSLSPGSLERYIRAFRASDTDNLGFITLQGAVDLQYKFAAVPIGVVEQPVQRTDTARVLKTANSQFDKTTPTDISSDPITS